MSGCYLIGGYVIGLCGSREGDASATFFPASGVTYQIHPVNTYSITIGDYVKGVVVDAAMSGQSPATVDFTKEGGDVTLVHSGDNRLIIQKKN